MPRAPRSHAPAIIASSAGAEAVRGKSSIASPPGAGAVQVRPRSRTTAPPVATATRVIQLTWLRTAARIRSTSSSNSVQSLDEHRLTHAAGHAHRLDPVGLVERLEVVEQRGHDPRSGHPERVAERNRAAERVELVVADAKLVLAGHD